MGCGRSNDCLFVQCSYFDEKGEVVSPPATRQDEEDSKYARISTKRIYTSRRAWNVQSYSDKGPAKR